MYGIFGSNRVNKDKLIHSKQRGTDSSSLIYLDEFIYKVNLSDYKIEKLLKKVQSFNSRLVFCHSRLIPKLYEAN